MSKLIFKNFGPIKKGEIGLEKKLTILCGPNNSGKTYISTLLYALFRNTIHPNNDYELFKLDKNQIISTHDGLELNIILNLNDIYRERKKKILDILSDLVKGMIPMALGSDNLAFNEAEFEFVIDDDSEYLNDIYEIPFGGNYLYNEFPGIRTNFLKPEKDYTIIFKISKLSNGTDDNILKDCVKIINNIILQNFLFRLLSGYKKGVFYLPAERLTIDLFIYHIMTSLLSNNKDIPLYKSYSFSSSIVDLIQIRQSLAFGRKKYSKFNNLANEIESFLGGNIVISDDGEILYEVNEKAIGMNMTSTSVRSLSLLITYFRYFANDGDLVFVDEPELGLHPDLQRKIAILIAKIVKQGFKVVISTHSEFIIKEFNNLIMLNQNSKEAKKLRRKYQSIGYSEDTVINYSDVKAYLFENNEMRSLSVDEFGFEVESIDNVIVSQNEVTNDILFTLKYE